MHYHHLERHEMTAFTVEFSVILVTLLQTLLLDNNTVYIVFIVSQSNNTV